MKRSKGIMKSSEKQKIINIKYRRIMENSLINLKTEGYYHSFWLGRLFNSYIKKGKKNKVYKHLYLSFLKLKINYNVNPLLQWFETLEYIKPTFRLVSIFPSKTLVIYPQVALYNKQYSIALRWFKEAVKMNLGNIRRARLPFHQSIFSSICYLRESKNKILFRKRDNYLNEAIRLQDHIRFTWVSE